MLLQEYVNLYVFTPGRVVFAVRRVRQIAAELGNAPVVAACDAALAPAGSALDLEQAWAKARTTRSGKRAKAPGLDAQVDRTLSALATTVDGVVAALPADSPRAAAALLFRGQAFPSGPGALTSLPYEDELAAVQSLLRRCTGSGDLVTPVERLQIQYLVDRLGELAGQFQEVLGQSSTRELGYDQVVDARAATQEKLLKLFVKILGIDAERPEDEAHLSRLLAPILEQNARIGQSMKRRSRVLDVDPETGEEREPPVSGPPVAT